MNEPMSVLEEIFGEPISVYSRAMAIDDGTLTDLSALYPNPTRKFFKLQPCARIGVMSTIERAAGANEASDDAGLVGYVVAAARVAAGKNLNCDRFTFHVPLKMKPGIERIEMVLHIGPGDSHEPV